MKIFWEFFLVLLILWGSIVADRCDYRFKTRKEKETFNKGVLLDFFFEAVEQPQNFLAAAPKYFVAEGFIQHGPFRADGRDAYFAEYMSYYRNSTVGPTALFAHIAGDGDLVWIHTMQRSPSNLTMQFAVVNIFRFDCGLIMEHWEVVQPIDPGAVYANSHPFF